jgi:branched-chain amino acid transport system permease protein
MKRAALVVIFALLLLVPVALPAYAVQVAIQAVIVSIYAMAFNLLFHETGLLSFGHAAFYGMGAYATALLITRLHWPYLAALPAALAATTLVSIVIGFLSVRMTKIYFTMLTLAFAQMLWAVVHKWYGFTGGDNGITGLMPAGWLGTAAGLYYLALALLVAVAAIIWRIVFSPAGYALRALRDNPARAVAIGIGGFEYMLAAFVVSGMLSGAAGFLHVGWQRSAFPDVFYWTTSAEVIIAVILGGSDYFYGPIIGATVLVSTEALVRSRTQYWPLALGIVLLALVLFAPRGVLGLFHRETRTAPGEPPAKEEPRRVTA